MGKIVFLGLAPGLHSTTSLFRPNIFITIFNQAELSTENSMTAVDNFRFLDACRDKNAIHQYLYVNLKIQVSPVNYGRN
jgi:hypothetical protein